MKPAIRSPASSDDVALNFGRAGVERAAYRVAHFTFEFEFRHKARAADGLNRVEAGFHEKLGHGGVHIG
jgi:hypothetical protein